MSSDPATCVVLVPVGNHIEPQTEQALRELERRGYPVWRSFGCSAIDFARSRLATQALSEGFEETLWIDADIVFDPDEVDRLRGRTFADIQSAGGDVLANKQDKPLVLTGVYAKKGVRELALQFYASLGETLQFGVDAPFRKAIYAPGGMLLVRRRAYELIVKGSQLPHCTTNESFGMIPFFMPMIISDGNQSIYLCEDFAFSRRVRDAGMDIWVDMQMRLYHLGNYPYSWEDAGKAVERFHSYRFVLQAKPSPGETNSTSG
ncbi:MAG: hypothetical protein WCH39_16730 [Schlesneria sp.]